MKQTISLLALSIIDSCASFLPPSLFDVGPSSKTTVSVGVALRTIPYGGGGFPRHTHTGNVTRGGRGRKYGILGPAWTEVGEAHENEAWVVLRRR